MRRRFIDIGINLTDAQFQGIYHGKHVHKPDLRNVIDRARMSGVEKMIITGSNLPESQKALEICKAGDYAVDGQGRDADQQAIDQQSSNTNHHVTNLYCTVGVHPCHAGEIAEKSEPDQKQYLEDLESLAKDPQNRRFVKAFGEIGLDYDRFHYASKETQQTYFQKQLEIAVRLDLPLFLHSRACHEDFTAMLKPFLPGLPRRGVVHSFTGTIAEMTELVEMGFYIGLNGCSLKTAENLEVAKEVPLDRLLLETDGPWCEMRPSHASSTHIQPHKDVDMPFPSVKKEKWAPNALVKGRCEPCAMPLVARVIASVKKVPYDTVVEAAYENSVKLFGFD